MITTQKALKCGKQNKIEIRTKAHQVTNTEHICITSNLYHKTITMFVLKSISLSKFG